MPEDQKIEKSCIGRRKVCQPVEIISSEWSSLQLVIRVLRKCLAGRPDEFVKNRPTRFLLKLIHPFFRV
jgi:hypothetical protein